MKGLLIFILSSFIFFKGISQECTFELKGFVKDEQGEVLPGATIWISSINKGFSTGQDGSFQFEKLCAGVYYAEVRFVGYQDIQVEFSIPSREIPCIVLHSVQVLHEVVIEGEHLQQHNLSQAVSSIQQHELEKLRGKPLGEMLKQLPGVNALVTGPAIFKPIIQGLYGQRILVLNNGVRLEGQQWGMDHAPEVDPFTAANIEVVKGAEAVRYGSDAMGGVVILSPASLRKMQKLGGEVHLIGSTNGRSGIFSALLEGQLNNSQRWNWRVQSSLKGAGDYHAANYNLSNTGSKEINASAAIAYYGEQRTLEFYISTYNTTIGILRSAHTGNMSDLQQSIENETPWYIQDFTYSIDNPKQTIHHHLFKTKSSMNIGALSKLYVQYGLQLNQREEFDIRRGGRGETPAMSLSLLTNTLDISIDRNKNNRTSSLGISATFKNNTNEPDLGIKPLLPQYNQVNAGVFLLEKIRKGHWLLEAGARYDFQQLLVSTFDANNNLIKPLYQFHFGAASLGGSYYLNNTSRIINNISLSTRPPHVSELFSEGLHHSTGSIEEGILYNKGDWSIDQKIHKETSYKWSTTYQIEKNNLAFEISGYANRINNFVSLQPQDTRLTIRGYFPVFTFIQTDVLLIGTDASLTLDINKHISYTGKASYVHADDVINNDRLVYIPPAQMEHAFTYHLNWSKWHETFLTIRVPTYFKQTRAPRTLYPEDVAGDTSDKNFDFMPAPDGYTLLHFEAGTTFPLAEHSLTISFSAENILNTSYRNYMNRLRYFADDTGANFSLRLAYKFHTH